MNKLMVAAVAAVGIGSVCVADVTSANVVGYSNTEVGDQACEYQTNFKIIMNQFRNVDGTELTMTLGQITANQEFDEVLWDCVGFGINDTIQLFGTDGKTKGLLTYCSKSYIENACFTVGTPGWYTYIDASAGNFANCLNDTVLKFGEGFIVKAGKGNGVTPALTFSGAVKDAKSDIPGVSFAFTGNCSPVAIKLGDITTNQLFDETLWDCYGFGINDTIQFFGTDGKTKGMLTYCSKSYIEQACFTVGTEGWYTYIDAAAGNFSDCKNNTPVPAGEAFIMKCGDGNGVTPTITIPCALAKDDDK